MSPKLTQGSIKAMFREEEVKNPIVQLLNHQPYTLQKTPNLFYRLIIWDGVITTDSVVMATRLNDLITSGQLQKYSIIRLDKYICRGGTPGKKMKKVLGVSKLSILMAGDVVGNKICNANFDGALLEASTDRIPVHFSSPVASPMIGQIENVCKPQEILKINLIDGLIQNEDVSFIKVRLLQKGYIRSTSIGNVFTMDLIDASGAIRASAIKDACDRLYDMMELNKIFLISRCLRIPATHKFTTIPHDFELILNQESVVVRCEGDDCSIPKIYFRFSMLSELKNISDGTFIDIVGICVSISDLETFEVAVKSKKLELKKREIRLVDMSNASFTVILSDSLSHIFDISYNPVITITGVGIYKFRGLKVGLATDISQLQFNPDLPESHKLRKWYDSLDSNHKFSSV